jgi:DNA polymerase-3 subunit alpha (Gram-positive type)
MEAIAIFIVVAAAVWYFTIHKKSSPKPSQDKSTDVPVPSHTITQATEQAPEPTEFAFVDLETTGLDPSEDRIIEVAVLFYQEGTSRFKGYSALANPGIEIPERITELTGITAAMVNGKDSTAIVVAELMDAIGERPIVAYNAEFDMSFLRREAGRLGRPLPNKSHCLMEYTKKKYPNLRRYRLQDVCAAFRIEAESSLEQGLSPHRAMFDAERAVRLYIAQQSGKEPEEEFPFDETPYGRRLDHNNNAQYHGMRSSAKLLQQEAKTAEATDIEQAIYGYRSALKLHIESAKVQIYVAVRKDNTQSLFPESGDIECLNRLTLCMCKVGRADEAQSAIDDYLSAFPKDAELKTAEQVRRRVEKALAKVQRKTA